MLLRTLPAAIVVTAMVGGLCVAQSPTLLREFNDAPSANPHSGASTAWAQLGSKAYLSFTTAEHGSELWTYDALSSHFAEMTEGLFPGSSPYVGDVENQIAFNGRVYFTAWTMASGRELYKTDGTVAGTSLVKDIKPGNPDGGPYTSGPSSFVVFGNQLFFTADDGSNGRQLWKTDGSEAGTVVADPAAPTLASNLDYVSTPAALFFVSSGQLFRLTLSPDTVAGISTLYYGEIRYPAAIGNSLYFQAESTSPLDTIGAELYRSDGTSISLCKNIRPVSGESGKPSYLTEFGGKLYFAATYAVAYHTTWGSQRSDTELFEYDPVTDALTGHNLNATPYTSTYYAPQISNSSYPGKFLENNNKLFFTARDGVNGTELWTVDGAGTVTMLDPAGLGGIRPGSDSASPGYLTVASSTKIVFSANDGVHGTEIWESDGTNAGTILGGDHNPGSGSTGSIKIFPSLGAGLCLFRGNNYNGWNTELHSYQVDANAGVPGTLAAIADVNPQNGITGDGGIYNYEGLVDTGRGKALFAAKAYDALGNPLGDELWSSNGTPGGTVFVKDIRVGSSGSSLRQFCQAGSLTYFQATDGTVGSELYFSNGVPAGQPGHTFGLAADIKVGGTYDSGRPQYITYVGGNRVVFAATDGLTGSSGNQSQLFWAVGNSWGAVPQWIDPDGPGGQAAYQVPVYSPEKLVYHGGQVYFGGGNDDTNTKTWDLFTTDGKSVVRRTHMDFGRSPGIVYFDEDRLFFSGYFRVDQPGGVNAGYQLYVADYDFTSITRLTNENVWSSPIDPTGAAPSPLVEVNGLLFFGGESEALGGELWITDGTVAGTHVWKDINPGAAGSGPYYLHALDGALVFSAYEPTHGREIWSSDGSLAGTSMLLDATPGVGDGWPSYLTRCGSRKIVYRYGRYTDVGSELWQSDGTVAGTRRLTDINPDNGDAAVLAMQLTNGLLTFEADNWRIGIETYALDVGANVKSFGISTAPASHSRHVTIRGTDAILGTPYTISGQGALPGSTCGLAVSFVSGETVFQGLSIYIDPIGFSVAGFTAADVHGRFSFAAQQLPANPAFHGADLVYQAASINPAGLFRSRLSNALYVNVGTF